MENKGDLSEQTKSKVDKNVIRNENNSELIHVQENET